MSHLELDLSIRSIRSTRSTQSTRSTRSTRSTQNTRSTRGTRGTQGTRSTLSIRSTRSTRSTRNIRSTRSTRSIRSIRSTRGTRNPILLSISEFGNCITVLRRLLIISRFYTHCCYAFHLRSLKIKKGFPCCLRPPWRYSIYKNIVHFI